MRKIKVAFIKFCGMATGGTEKVLQTVAANLPKDKFEVDFYYCDSAPYIGSNYIHPDNDPSREEYCRKNGVNLIKFSVGHKNVSTPTHDWVDTDFWEVFDEDDYDVIQTGRAGHPEYPFTHIHKTPIVDSIHLAGMAENKENVYKTILISQEQRQKWINAGGPADKSVIIPNPVEIPKCNSKFETNGKFVFGLHQRDDNGIFSPIPLEAYDEIETDETMFMILGGGSNYRKQASDLGLKNVLFFDKTSDLKVIHKFLNSLDVYAHGRSDGEQCSCAIIEALSHSLPIISHVAPSMGHKEQIGDGGEVVIDYFAYAQVMREMMEYKDYRNLCSENAKKQYTNVYNINTIIEKYSSIYEEVVSNVQ